jgi:hypothetical protein
MDKLTRQGVDNYSGNAGAAPHRHGAGLGPVPCCDIIVDGRALERRTFKWAHLRRFRDGGSIVEVQNTPILISRPML